MINQDIPLLENDLERPTESFLGLNLKTISEEQRQSNLRLDKIATLAKLSSR